MSKELPKAYEAKNSEKKWYSYWESNNFFKANPLSTKPAYCIVIPPPNVTGNLHMGHALDNTIIDILIRWKRMSGFEALWVPGTDHAGIATQTVVERNLIRLTGKKRKDFSREEFLKHVWDWKENSESTILNQLRSLGSSCDWSRQRFTMDEKNNLAVRTMFKKLFDQKLIYRGDYLVNWDPVTQTALADDEVEYEERNSFLWYFKYPFKDGSGYVTVATTRPETMLGDTAVAVSPQDPRFANQIGKIILHPITNREIPLITDHRIDAAFGTGMVKITPSHDHVDYQIGLTHQLPFINIMTPDGFVNDNGKQFAGLSMQDAREKVIEEIERLGLYVKKEPHINRVGVSYRSKAVIEPYMSKQWFIKMDGFAKTLKEIVNNGQVKLLPKNWEAVYFHWIDNLRDWCISRQLWWGHRIPIWYNINDPNEMICYEGEGEPEEVKKNPGQWRQDEDVLDTWFSSSLWPFATLGWPEKTPDLTKFYPNSVLVTGYDILFFWVARMLLMGNYAMDKPPFPETFLHGLIYGKSYWRNNANGGITYCSEKEREEFDLGKTPPSNVISKWEKMSKSKGNILDPLVLIDQYGADALRMGLCASTPQAREIDLDRRRFEEFKNFANKVWNGARFVLMNLSSDTLPPLTSEIFNQGLDLSLLNLEDRWILSTLNRTIKDVNDKLASYTFDQAALEAYEFFWDKFCAYYVEISKPILFGKAGTPEQRLNKLKLLVILLCQSIRLLHPMAPFITEELFQILKDTLPDVKLDAKQDAYTKEAIVALQSPACIVAPYPTVVNASDNSEESEQLFQTIQQIVYSIRNIRGEMKLPPGTSTEVHLTASEKDLKIIGNHQHIIAALIKTHGITLHDKEPKIPFSSTSSINAITITIPLPQELLSQEKTRLAKELQKLQDNQQKLQTQLSNGEFTAKAPPQLIEKLTLQLKQTEADITVISSKLQSFG